MPKQKVTADAMHYGMVRHHFPKAIGMIEDVLEQGFTPEQIEENLNHYHPRLRPSWRMHFVGAARYISKESST